MSDPPVRYRIDSEGRIVWVDDGFRSFADENGAVGLAERVLGADLFSQMTGAPVVAVYRALLTRLASVREPVSFDYRCDASNVRRRMRMRVRTLDDDGFEFVSITLDVAPRVAVPLELVTGSLEPPPPDEELLHLCAWCKRVAISGVGWVEVEDAVTDRGLLDRLDLPHVTHAVCPRCEAGLMSA